MEMLVTVEMWGCRSTLADQSKAAAVCVGEAHAI